MTRILPILLGEISRLPEDHLYEWSAFDLRLPDRPIATTHVVALRDSTKRPTVTGSIKCIDPRRLRLHTTTDRVYQLDGPPFDRSVSKFLAFQWATDMEALSAKDSTQKIVEMLSVRAQHQFMVTLGSTPADFSDVLCELRIHSLGERHFASMPICIIPGYGTSWRQPVIEVSSHQTPTVVSMLRRLLPKLTNSDRDELRPAVSRRLSLSTYEGPDISDAALREHLIAERDGRTIRVELCTASGEYKASGCAQKYTTTASMLEHAIDMVLPAGSLLSSESHHIARG